MNSADPRFIRDHFHQLCRFCLSESAAANVQCIPIFTGEYELNEQLTKVLDVLLAKVDAADGFPNNVCLDCVTTIERYVDFEARCVRSYELLERALAEVDQVEEIKRETLSQEQDDELQHEEEFLAEETVEPEDNENLEAFQEEEVVEQQEEQTNVEGEQTDEMMDEDELEEPSESTSYNLNEEQQKMLDLAMAAKSCGFVERSSRKIPLIECIYCKNVYRGRNTLKKHLKIHLNIKDYRCAHCPRTFTDRSSFRIHEGRHKGKSFECSHCGKAYFSQNELRQHQTMQHLERKFECETCRQKFPSKTILNDHQRVHLDERPFVCSECGMGFKRNRNLVRHQLLHRKQPAQKSVEKTPGNVSKRDYYCGECTQKFKTRKQALEHLKEHEGDSHYVCDRGSCRMLFGKKSLYDLHQSEVHSVHK
uniref:Putative c2h2-type zn-finger protein n=1 Tax=Culex tarsalis TaxID=7177 RepID=A0A1Q3F1X4_CULTA